jgi:hypothetical protein
MDGLMLIPVVSIDDAEDSYKIISSAPEYDMVAKKLAQKLADSFDVTLQIFNGVVGGSINCQYCGSRTRNLQVCDNCGGKPI